MVAGQQQERRSRPQPVRNETPAERADRNWSELLQELRVAQTGVQLLTAFLLSLPFQQRFGQITTNQKVVYLVVVLLSVAATGVLIAPVAIHRAVFQRNEKARLVGLAATLATVGLALLATAVTGVVMLIFLVSVGPEAGIVAGAGTGLMLLVLWTVVPLAARRRR
jgi:Family of unknown function (DUF6328)